MRFYNTRPLSRKSTNLATLTRCGVGDQETGRRRFLNPLSAR